MRRKLKAKRVTIWTGHYGSGTIILDSTLIAGKPSRADVRAFAMPATDLAAQAGLEGLSNMALAGKFLRECLHVTDVLLERALLKVVPLKKANLMEANRRALELGRGFEG